MFFTQQFVYFVVHSGFYILGNTPAMEGKPERLGGCHPANRAAAEQPVAARLWLADFKAPCRFHGNDSS